jgi:outer membrane protein assembly factor BamB
VLAALVLGGCSWFPLDTGKYRGGKAKAAPEGAWPTYGFDAARTRYAPFRLRPPYRRLWRRFIGGTIEFPPSAAGGRLYVAQLQGNFYALDGATGATVWHRRFYGRCSAASPAIADGAVYEPYLPAPCAYGPRGVPSYVAAMDADTGRLLWRYPSGPTESSPVVLGRRLYFADWDGDVYCFDTRTHRLLWRYPTDGEIDGAPAYAAHTIFVGTNAGSVYAIDARDGSLRWRFSGGGEYFYPTPAVAYGRVFVGNTNGTLYALSAGSGAVLWTRYVGTYVYTSAAVWRGRVYAGAYDGTFAAYNARTGDELWRFSASAAIHGAPAVVGGLVYFSTCSHCGASGSRYAKEGPRNIYALDARTGRVAWIWPGIGTYSPVVADRERLYLLGRAQIFGLEPKSAAGAGSTSR